MTSPAKKPAARIRGKILDLKPKKNPEGGSGLGGMLCLGGSGSLNSPPEGQIKPKFHTLGT